MKSWPSFLFLGLFLAAGPICLAQVPAEKALKTLTVSDGLESALWAAEPLFVNPTCMDIDHKGRVWVCESINYRDTLRGKPIKRPEGDRILILEDSKGEGKADRVTTFYQTKEVLAPLGIAVAKDPVGPGYKVYVCQSPDILLFDDRDGDGKADGPPRKLLSGFRGVDHDHGVHGILIGPDNRLYFSVGDQGVQGLVDKHGKVWTTNSTDCRAGTVWRCDQGGKNLERIAHNFRNEYEPCIDSFGTLFVSDNDDDGNQQTRICYVMPGGNYGYHPRGPGQTHWHEEQPGVVPKILRTYFGSPTGMCVYEGTLLPARYRGQLLHTDAGPRHLRCYHLTPDGAGYSVEREDMVASTDNWFRPADVCVAPDGSLYVADWYDPGVGGHGMGDITRGRIYRIAPKGHKPVAVKVDLNSKEGILAALASPALSVRYMAMAKLRTMPQKEVEPVLREAVTQRTDAVLRARGLWQLADLSQEAASPLNPIREAALAQAAADPDPRFRILAVRIQHDFFGRVSPLVSRDASPAVRRDALLALRDLDPVKAKPLLLELARGYDGKDRFYLEAIGIAVGQDPQRRGVILADFTKQFPDWNERVANLIWELRPPQVLPLLEKRIADAAVPAAERAQIVDILASSDEVAAGNSLLAVLGTDVPQDVRERVLDNLRLFLPGKWRALRSTRALAATIDRLLSQPATRAAGLTLIGAAERIESLDQVAALARNTQEPGAVRTAAIQALAVLPTDRAVDVLVALLQGEPALRDEAVLALGRHAQQQPRRADETMQPALAALKRVVQGKDQDPALRQSAAAALAGARLGATWLLDLESKKELPDALRPEVARLLRNTPYQDLRNRALIAFPPPGKIDPNKLPSVAALALRKGNAQRGQQIMVASIKNDLQCQKCHTVRGVGGNVGPDLSMIGKKASRENLVESILLPSKAIADQYLTWVIDTKRGQNLSGLLVEETTDSLTLRDANAKDIRIDKKDVEERTKSPTSLMPNNLLVYMTEEDLVDIVEYLATLKTPSLAVSSWHIAGPFDNGVGDAGLDQVFPPEKTVDLDATYSGKSGSVPWRTVKTDTQGYVDLKAFLGGDSTNAVSYLYRAIESPADQETVLHLGTDDGAKLWINGALVYASRAHRAAQPEQDTVRVKLKKGKNTVLLKINNGDGPHGFYFMASSEQELKCLGDK